MVRRRLSDLIRQGCRSALAIVADAEVARAAVAAAPGTTAGPSEEKPTTGTADPTTSYRK